ncbi:MAG: hypothetical protein FRX49_01046 [Trebouxia sp. A1-2]|nr:MAG: hypothetical protein FRX49_01046 [Trebouxia sp. A1-2]
MFAQHCCQDLNAKACPIEALDMDFLEHWKAYDHLLRHDRVDVLAAVKRVRQAAAMAASANVCQETDYLQALQHITGQLQECRYAQADGVVSGTAASQGLSTGHMGGVRPAEYANCYVTEHQAKCDRQVKALQPPAAPSRDGGADDAIGIGVSSFGDIIGPGVSSRGDTPVPMASSVPPPLEGTAAQAAVLCRTIRRMACSPLAAILLISYTRLQPALLCLQDKRSSHTPGGPPKLKAVESWQAGKGKCTAAVAEAVNFSG